MKSERRKTKYCLIAMAQLLALLGPTGHPGSLYKTNNFGWFNLTIGASQTNPDP